MGDVPQIPEDRAHERIVLDPELLIGQGRDQKESAIPGLEELPGNKLAAGPAGDGNRGHEFCGPIRLRRLLKIPPYHTADSAGPRDSRSQRACRTSVTPNQARRFPDFERKNRVVGRVPGWYHTVE